METQLLLAGDIGGTKTILGLFSHEKGALHLHHEVSYASSEYPDLDAIIKDFFSQASTTAKIACFGVAGPVREGRAVITNLPWQPDTHMLQASHGFSRAMLINDLVAIGYAIPHLPASDLFVINEGIIPSGGNMGIIAPGTGLGEAVFAWDGSQYMPVPSEGGHTDFAPVSEVEMALLRFLNKQYGHVSYDRVCSGRGLPGIYDFLKEHLQLDEPGWLAAELAAAEDRTPVIVNTALQKDRPCEICLKTLEMFLSILAAESGNLALQGMTTAGIYLGGGMLPRILPLLQKENFMVSFSNKGRMSYLLNDIPVKVILNPKAALIGAASHGLGLKFQTL